MRSKKVFLIIVSISLLFLYNLDHTSAISYNELKNITFDMDKDITYGDVKCTNGSEDGDYTIKWNEKKKIMGAVYNHYQKYNSEPETLDEKYDSKSEANTAADEFLSWSAPACCRTDDPKEGGCKGSPACNKPNCAVTEVDCKDEVTGASGTCTCGITKPNGLTITAGELGCTKDKNTCSAVCSPGKSLGGSCSTTSERKCKYRVQCSKNKLVPTNQWIDGERNIYAFYYEMDISGTDYDKDDVYCVQPGAHGPGKDGLPYVLNTSFDISKCQDQFTKYNSETNKDERAVYCGLAHIMYQAYNIDTTTLKFTTFKSDKYTPASLILALRLWMAAYGKGTDGPGLGIGGAEEAILGWIPKEPFYEKTASLIKNGKTYDTSNAAITKDKVEGRIGCAEKVYDDTPPRCVIDQAIELFHNTETVKKEDYLGGLNFNKSEPIVQIIDDSRDIQITWDEGDIRKIDQECDDFNNPKCIIEPHAYMYVNGKMVDVTDKLKIEKDLCVKNTCRFIPKGIMSVCLQGGSYVKVVLVFKNWYQNQGEIKFYTYAGPNPQNYQVMMSMSSKITECYQEGKGKKQGRIEREIDCGCPPSTCTDLSSKTSYETDAVCNPKTTVSDASMDCIANACDPKSVVDYDVTSEYSVDPQVCTLYEREDNDLYTPGVVSVYSGMQFSYDLSKDLAKRGIDTKSNKKLTNAIIQKKQITAQIHYDYWKSEYDRKLSLLKDAYQDHRDNYSNEYRASVKKDITAWIDALKNCNMYSDASLVTEIDNKVDELVKCKDDSCNAAKVAVEYKSGDGEKKYGEKQTLAVERHKLNNNKYYCHGSDCYKYESGSNFTEPNMTNHTIKLKYYNCSSSCSETTIEIPDNTYATMIYNIEHDYYNDKKYYVNAYTGNVSTSSSGEDISTPLADYSYPISGNTKTSISGYPIQFYFTELSNKKLKGYSTTSSCLIKVYNRTTAYDCKTTNSKGNTDLSNCEDNKYNIVNGIPIISDNQIEWTSTNKKQYGFVARFIDLDNPFPSGLDNRTSIINWTTDDVEEIKKTANDIFTNSEYLEYSYVLTPTAIKEIKEYNKNQVDAGGYQNQTLEDCKVTKDESGLSTFTECRSTFLHGELRKYDGVEISGNKAGAY